MKNIVPSMIIMTKSLTNGTRKMTHNTNCYVCVQKSTSFVFTCNFYCSSSDQHTFSCTFSSAHHPVQLQ